MAPQSLRLAFIAVCLVLLARVSAITTKGAGSIYCSDINTSSGSSTSQQYQSHGACSGTCSGYAFAITQNSNCWCSNDAPSGSNSTTGCTQRCPGYGFEFCGAESENSGGFFNYLQLSAQPSGTIGGNSAAASSTSATESSSASQKQTSSSTSTSATWTPTPVTSVYTTTGQVRTVTLTPTAAPGTQSGLGVNKSSGGGLGTGGAVGLTIGLVALFAIIGGALWFCLRKKKKQKEADDFAYGSRRGSSAGLGGPALEGGKLPQRTMSEHSRYALATDGRQVVEAWEPGDVPNRRQSRLMPVDPRLDPFAPVYQRGDHNKSRESVNTIRDDHDYSRRVVHQGPILRATNPDASTNDD